MKVKLVIAGKEGYAGISVGEGPLRQSGSGILGAEYMSVEVGDPYAYGGYEPITTFQVYLKQDKITLILEDESGELHELVLGKARR